MNTSLTCTCGAVRLDVERDPIVSVECCCTSCRTAGAQLEALPGAPPLLEESGATRFELYRKDRVRCVQGAEHLKGYRLTPASKTRRVVATCCNTPFFLEISQGHWLSLYGRRWPEGALPPLQMRTMASDLPPGTSMPGDVPNAKRQSLSFFFKLLKAWAAMGFRAPELDYVRGDLATG